jgi:hypothetical protein
LLAINPPNPHEGLDALAVLNLETNTVVESCHVTFDETAPCTLDVFEGAGDKEVEESIFVDEEL